MTSHPHNLFAVKYLLGTSSIFCNHFNETTSLDKTQNLRKRLISPHRVIVIAWSLSVGAWRSLVARLLWEQEAPGSNPGAPTTIASRVGIGSYRTPPSPGIRSQQALQLRQKNATPCQESAAACSHRPSRTAPIVVTVLSKTTVPRVTRPDATNSANRSLDTRSMPSSPRYNTGE